MTRTCTHTGVSGSNIVLLCQDFVENSVQIVPGVTVVRRCSALSGGQQRDAPRKSLGRQLVRHAVCLQPDRKYRERTRTAHDAVSR